MFRDTSLDLCGDAGGVRYCFPPCNLVDRSVTGSRDNLVEKDRFHISCYLYDNGCCGGADQTPANIEALFAEFVVNNGVTVTELTGEDARRKVH